MYKLIPCFLFVGFAHKSASKIFILLVSGISDDLEPNAEGYSPKVKTRLRVDEIVGSKKLICTLSTAPPREESPEDSIDRAIDRLAAAVNI